MAGSPAHGIARRSGPSTSDPQNLYIVETSQTAAPARGLDLYDADSVRPAPFLRPAPRAVPVGPGALRPDSWRGPREAVPEGCPRQSRAPLPLPPAPPSPPPLPPSLRVSAWQPSRDPADHLPHARRARARRVQAVQTGVGGCADLRQRGGSQSLESAQSPRAAPRRPPLLPPFPESTSGREHAREGCNSIVRLACRLRSQ